jgi:hypothetical protein
VVHRIVETSIPDPGPALLPLRLTMMLMVLLRRRGAAARTSA